MDEVIDNSICPTVVLNDAEYLLDKIFISIPKLSSNSDIINIIVIGAGIFPSFVPLVKTIKKFYPNIKTLNFNLVDQDVTATTTFKSKCETLIDSFKNIFINIVINNIDIKEYLINYENNKKYDLIYFERPDSSIFNFHFAYIKYSSCKLAISMQESIPYLKNILKNSSVIIGSFIYKDDLKHLNHLLKYCLNIKTKKIKVNKFSTHASFTYGLVGSLNPKILPEKEPQEIVNNIKLYRLFYCIILILSVFLFLATPTRMKLISFYFVIIQLFYHRYNITSTFAKIMLIVGQLCLPWLLAD